MVASPILPKSCPASSMVPIILHLKISKCSKSRFGPNSPKLTGYLRRPIARKVL